MNLKDFIIETPNFPKNGILFIDEAYTLKRSNSDNDYGQDAIDMLLERMEDFRGNLIIIVAGYETEMNYFINSTPGLKSRFNRYFHFKDYDKTEIMSIVSKYLSHYDIEADRSIIEKISWKVEHTPREIHNICVKIRDYLIAQDMVNLAMHSSQRDAFEQWLNVEEGWITPLHRQYLDILAAHDDAVWVKTLAAKLGMNEKALETDIEPLLLKLGKIEKTTRGRVLR